MNGLALDSGEFISADELNARWLPRKATEEEMIEKQPNALRLADEISSVRAPYCGAAAAELRRLAAVEQELEALKRAISEAEPVAEITEVGENVGVVEWLVHSKGPIRVGQTLYTLKGIK